MNQPTRLDPRVRLVWMAGSLIPVVVLVVATAALFLLDVPVAPWVTAGIALVIALLAVTVPPARWRSWSYLLTDTELIVRFGVVIRVERWLPRTRVQHVDMVGGPIERSLGLRQLVIYTAGTREADVTIPGLPTAAAEELRSELLSWSRDADPNADLDDDDTMAHAHHVDPWTGEEVVDEDQSDRGRSDERAGDADGDTDGMSTNDTAAGAP